LVESSRECGNSIKKIFRNWGETVLTGKIDSGLSQNLQAGSRVGFILIVSVTGLFVGAPDISVNLRDLLDEKPGFSSSKEENFVISS
jgi:hypothetical protein